MLTNGVKVGSLENSPYITWDLAKKTKINLIYEWNKEVKPWATFHRLDRRKCRDCNRDRNIVSTTCTLRAHGLGNDRISLHFYCNDLNKKISGERERVRQQTKIWSCF
jgi:hypothetical protein